MENSVIISGVSLFSPLGLNIDENWENLIKGNNSFSNIESFDASPFSTKIAGEIKSLINHKEKYLFILERLIEELLIDSGFTKNDLSKTVLSLGSSFLGIELNKTKK
ncbi:MAG TPA: beta-ketoacyl synthase N-terminal-like domain-containing protein, partial [Spirochaetota bacterium]|nr:beta-ketoacyl synthase N-terminal-like domain-containing protein [Spirochaetota bacterium]